MIVNEYPPFFKIVISEDCFIDIKMCLGLVSVSSQILLLSRSRPDSPKSDNWPSLVLVPFQFILDPAKTKSAVEVEWYCKIQLSKPFFTQFVLETNFPALCI